MNNELVNELFDFDIDKYKRISITKNEIYNELMLYIFFKSNKNLLIVVPTINEATDLYNELRNYISSVYIFPEDDIITKNAIASSPELLYIRVNLLNKIANNEKKIIILHLNSYIKKLPSKNSFIDNKIHIEKGSKINRETLIKKLQENGYKRESVVYNISDFAVRGFVIDIFPIDEENPIRIELFDDEVEDIKYFSIIDQKSIKKIDSIDIGVIKDDLGKNIYSIREYLDEKIVIFSNINQIKEQEKMILPQIKYLNVESELFKLKDLIKEEDIYLDTINNKNYDLKIESTSIDKYEGNKNRFVEDIVKNNGVLYSNNEKLNEELKKLKNNIKIKKSTLNHGFVYKNKYYFSEFDLFDTYKRNELVKESVYGDKILSIDGINIGDYVVHRKSGIGIYKGIKTIMIESAIAFINL